MTDTIRIVVAEDHQLFRDGLRQALAADGTVAIVAEASDGRTALAHIQALRPDVLVADIGMPGMDGMALVREIRRLKLPVEIVLLTVCNDEEMFEAALEWGVKGYLLKDCTPGEILRGIKSAAAGQHYTDPSMTTYLVQKTRRVERFSEQTAGLRLLTAQERSILRRIAQDKTSKEIAEEMAISPRTVDAHRLNICKKLELHGNHVLSRFAARHKAEI
jgi:DNA-binding NarL/FixJ family response regulator